ncbi:hypothetical protein Sste5346_004371 [Sporothrix stenoceras]|uniref:CBM-cenC domain-containing protein n=1 Tax=Sporothrix stenoceras TaxID=5173 RepID=A0ABR3Z811_9PEZI
MRFTTSILSSLAWYGTTVLANPCKPSTPASSSTSQSSSSSVAPSTSPSPSTVPAVCENLVQNPSFDEGDDFMDHWRITAAAPNGVFGYKRTAGLYCSPTYDATDSSPSPCYYVFNEANAAADFYLYQDDIPVIPGSTYTYTIRYRVSHCSATDAFFLYVNGAAVAHLYLAGEPNAWKTLSATWTAPTTGQDPTVATIGLSNNNLDASVLVYFADISFGTCTHGGSR